MVLTILLTRKNSWKLLPGTSILLRASLRAYCIDVCRPLYACRSRILTPSTTYVADSPKLPATPTSVDTSYFHTPSKPNLFPSERVGVSESSSSPEVTGTYFDHSYSSCPHFASSVERVIVHPPMEALRPGGWVSELCDVYEGLHGAKVGEFLNDLLLEENRGIDVLESGDSSHRESCETEDLHDAGSIEATSTPSSSPVIARNCKVDKFRDLQVPSGQECWGSKNLADKSAQPVPIQSLGQVKEEDRGFCLHTTAQQMNTGVDAFSRVRSHEVAAAIEDVQIAHAPSKTEDQDVWDGAIFPFCEEGMPQHNSLVIASICVTSAGCVTLCYSL